MHDDLPPDRGHVGTEKRHPHSMRLDTFDIAQCIDLFVQDHRQVTEAVAGAADAIERFIAQLVGALRAGGRLIYLGAGTSGRLGVLDASECPPTFQSDPNQIVGIIAGGDAALRQSSEGREDEPDGAADELSALNVRRDDIVLGIAAGGTTPYVLGGLRIAHERGATTGLLTCSAMTDSSEPEHVDHLIVLDTGPELLTGSTRLKAGSATKLALNIITTTAFVQFGKVYENLMVDLRATNAKLRDRAIRILQTLCPELDRTQAAEALSEAAGDLKTAIVMQRCGIDRGEAEQRLQSTDGVIRRALAR